MKAILDLKTILRFIGLRLFNRSFPFSVNLIINYNCNYRCKYCNSYNTKKKEMTTKQIFKMLDEFSELGTKRLGITGGEPLLRKDIGKIVDYAKKKGMKTTLTTNGSLVPQKIKELKNLDLLLISFDGPKEVHDKYRMKGSYESVIRAIKIAKENGINVWTTTVITNLTENNIEFVVKKAREMGFKCLFQPVYHYSYSSNKDTIEGMSAKKGQHKMLVQKIIELKRKGAQIANSYHYLDYILKYWPDKIHGKCYAGKFYCGVDSNGEVAPCSLIFGKYKWTNGVKFGFKEAFKKIKQIPCKGCFCVSFVDMNLLNSYLTPEIIINALKDYNF
ncbi:MAG: radical SAM protein [archaeon]